MRVRVYDKRKTTQDLINEERARLDSDFKVRLKNAEESMKAIYPEEYKKIRSRYFGNGNNLGLIGSQYNYIHDMITRRSDDQMKKYYNELNDYFIKQTGTKPGYMLPDVDVNEEYDPQGKIRDLTAVTPNSDYMNTVSTNNAKQSVYNSDAGRFNAGYEERLRDENPTAYDTWERAQNSPIVTAMEFSPLFPVVAGVKSVAAANAPQASGVDVGMNAAFASIPAIAKAKDIAKVVKIIPRAFDNTARRISPKYDLYRYIGETKPQVNETNLIKEQIYKPYSNFIDVPYTSYIKESENVKPISKMKLEEIENAYNSEIANRWTQNKTDKLRKINDEINDLRALRRNKEIERNKYKLDEPKFDELTNDINNAQTDLLKKIIDYDKQKYEGLPQKYLSDLRNAHNNKSMLLNSVIDFYDVDKLHNAHNYHGTTHNLYTSGKPFTEFNPSGKSNSVLSDIDKGTFLTTNKDAAHKFFGIGNNELENVNKKYNTNYTIDDLPYESGLYDLFVNGKVEDITNLQPTGKSINRIAIEKFKNGVKAVTSNDTRDVVGLENQTVVKSSNNMKLADAITIDDSGNVIPLSKRDNFDTKDIRYGLTGLGATGLGIGAGYKSQNNEQQQVYDNGGVLDATYNEQINRIRQPRFAGWRFKDGGIHIKEENRGKFTEYAKRHGKTVPQMEDEVLSNKNKYPSAIVKRAVFSRNARHWHNNN